MKSNSNPNLKIQDHKIWLNQELVFEASEELSTNDFLKSAYKNIGMQYLKFFKMDEMCKLGILGAAYLGVEDRQQKFQSHEVGLVFANASASEFTDQKYLETIANSDNYFPSPSLFVYTLPNIVLGEIAIKFLIKGENLFLVMPQFDAEALRNQAKILIDKGRQKAILIGWIEVNKSSYEAYFEWIE
jgi:hypothetical protein